MTTSSTSANLCQERDRNIAITHTRAVCLVLFIYSAFLGG